MTNGDNPFGDLQALITAVQTTGQNTNESLRLLGVILSALFLTRSVGTFTLGAAATTIVLNTEVQANSFPLLIATNAAAGTLMGSAKSLYLSARSVGASFTVATASAAAAAGTETFLYVLINPSS